MKKEDLINSASYALMKGLDYETFMYSDEMYGKEQYVDDVWKYVEQAKENGFAWFRNEYKDYQMYSF